MSKQFILICAVIAASTGTLRSQVTEVIESQFMLDWIEDESLAPVGQWVVKDGFWLEEIPWGVFEVNWPPEWGQGQELVADETWIPLDIQTLTSRQIHLLEKEDEQGFWDLSRTGFGAQWVGPVMRWNASLQQFERLMMLESAFGRFPGEENTPHLHMVSRTRDWPETSPLDSEDVLRLSIGGDGLYKIDRAWIAEAGFNPDTLDPGKVNIYGNGGRLMPMDNSEDRPLGLQAASAWFEGDENGQWDEGEFFVFWANGPHDIGRNNADTGWEHDRHAYEDVAHYFLHLDDEASPARIETSPWVAEPSDTLIDRYWNVQFHEQELDSPNRSGREWFGESFGTVNARTFNFNTPFATETPGVVHFRVAAQSMGVSSPFEVSAGQLLLEASPSYTSATSTSNVANLASATGTGFIADETGVDAEDARVSVNVTFQPSVEEAMGWLDYIRVEQECHLRLLDNSLHFHAPQVGQGIAEYAMNGTDELTRIWEITTPTVPVELSSGWAAGVTSWKAHSDTLRRFVAFRGDNFPKPAFDGVVEPTNLHGVERADLVIVTRPLFMEAAQRLANLHADEGLTVLLTTQRAVFDEFSSGSVDPTAIKMLMMMLRDRSLEGGWEPPRYLQLFGDGTFANRTNLEATPYIITYQSENSLSPTGSYVSDDYFGFLEDQYGEGIGDKLAIGVGRIPCGTASEAEEMVDKIEAYLQHPSADAQASGCINEGSGGDDGTWRNLICLVSDDMDGNGGPTEIEHMVNSDEHAGKIAENHPEYDVAKIYMDAYPQESTPGGERYPDAQVALDRQVRNGALIVNYIGHGGERGWSHERLLNTTTIQEWRNIDRMPLFMTATCELARFDDPEVESAGEMMVLNPKGGAIAMLTTTRVVFSGSNQQLNRAFYEVALQDTGDAPLRLGDIVRVTKNDPQVSNSSNKRNFSLLGDVALRLNYPREEIRFTEVPDTLKALDLALVRGYVSNTSGDTLADFNGIVHVKVFDKRSQITTLNNDGGPNPHSFQVFRNVLFSGVASAESGVFEFSFVVPRDIDYSFGNGRISAYAVSDSTDAHGASESMVIGGVADAFSIDDEAPVVQLYINDTTFVSGGLTDENPWLLARVFDEGGINASGAGIGHDIKATMDGQSDASIVLNDFYTTDLNTYQRGTVRYPFEEMEPGRHSIELVVWDVQNNKGTATVEFLVATSAEAALGQVLAYPNPSVDGFQFSIEHNQACQNGELVLEVFSSSGLQVHYQSLPWHEEGFRATGLRWEPSVPAGVYVFRLTLLPEAGTPVQYSDQLVVLRP